MHTTRNPELERELLDKLRGRYLTDKPIPHLTELTGCLTRSWFNRLQPLQPTDEELLFFAIGFALEDVLLRAIGQQPIESELLDGVWLTPDYVAVRGEMIDLKSTRMYADESGVPKKGLPDSWHEQFMGYCKKWGKTRYTAAILYLGQPKFACVTIDYTQEEIDLNWQNVQMRKGVYMAYLEKATEPPEPFMWNKEWECKSCRYALRCRSIASTAAEKAIESS